MVFIPLCGLYPAEKTMPEYEPWKALKGIGMKSKLPICNCKEMEQAAISTVDEEVFLSILAPYECWAEWKYSKACFLSKKEVLVIDFYEAFFRYRAAALELDLFVEPVSEMYNATAAQALVKLEHYFEYYQRWLES